MGANKIHPYYHTEHAAYLETNPQLSMVRYGEYNIKAQAKDPRIPRVEQDVTDADDLTCAQQLAKRRCVVISVCLAWAVYAVTSIVFDWLWVVDMIETEKSLVFGPPDDGILITLIIVSFIGTLTFIGEVVNGVEKAFYGREIFDETASQLFSLYLEEVPQMTLNILMASCREVPVSIYQLVKATLAIVGAMLRCLRVLVIYHTVRKRGERKRGLVPFVIRMVVLATCACLFAGSIVTWTFTFTVSTNKDTLGIKIPPNMIGEHYDGARYFYKSGIFFSHPNLTTDCELSKNIDDNTKPWVQLTPLMTFRDSHENSMKMTFTFNGANNTIHVASDTGVSCFKTTQCVTQKITCQNASTPLSSHALSHTMLLVFRETEPSDTLVFGDIKFDGTLTTNNECMVITSDEYGHLKTDSDVKHGRLHYLKAREQVNATEVYHRTSQGEYKHYNLAAHLMNVTDAWTTGYNDCPMTGSVAPNYKHGMGAEC